MRRSSSGPGPQPLELVIASSNPARRTNAHVAKLDDLPDYPGHPTCLGSRRPVVQIHPALTIRSPLAQRRALETMSAVRARDGLPNDQMPEW